MSFETYDGLKKVQGNLNEAAGHVGDAADKVAVLDDAYQQFFVSNPALGELAREMDLTSLPAQNWVGGIDANDLPALMQALDQGGPSIEQLSLPEALRLLVLMHRHMDTVIDEFLRMAGPQSEEMRQEAQALGERLNLMQSAWKKSFRALEGQTTTEQLLAGEQVLQSAHVPHDGADIDLSELATDETRARSGMRRP